MIFFLSFLILYPKLIFFSTLSKSYTLSEKDFNLKFRNIKGLGRSTKKALRKFFEEAKIK